MSCNSELNVNKDIRRQQTTSLFHGKYGGFAIIAWVRFISSKMTCIIKLNKAFFTLLLLKEQISQRCHASLTLKYSSYLGRDANINLDIWFQFTAADDYVMLPIGWACCQVGREGKEETHTKEGKYNMTMKQTCAYIFWKYCIWVQIQTE